MAKDKMETVEKIIDYEGLGEVYKTSDGELREQEMIDRIRQGESFVVESGKDKDGKKNVRALTVTTQGKLVFNDDKSDARAAMEVEHQELDEKQQEKKEKELSK